MKKFVVLVATVALAGCIERATIKDQDYDMQVAQSKLPAGCTLHYAGEVRVQGHFSERTSRIFFTVCKDAVTTTETHSVQQGKTTVDENNVTVVTK